LDIAFGWKNAMCCGFAAARYVTSFAYPVDIAYLSSGKQDLSPAATAQATRSTKSKEFVN
jgi:hypothetical protein